MVGAYQYIKQTMQKEFKGVSDETGNYKELQRQKLIEFRKQRTVTRIEKPSNLPRARELGYKAKQGVIVVRVKVRKGSGSHIRPNTKRRPKRMGVNKLTRRISKQVIAEQRAAAKFLNCEVVNSYLVGKDGKTHYFEVILVDRVHDVILSDKNLSNYAVDRGRTFRGKTSAGKKMRGHRKKGIGTEKNRPSLRAKNRKAK